MKLFVLLSALLILTTADKCGDNKSSNENVYKAKLEIKGICMNYTFRLLEGKLDTSMINSTWTDENTGKTYKNVFGFVNPCDFPSPIQQGDEFSFIIDSTDSRQCAVCLAYYPTPPKKLWIKVIND